MEQHEEVVLTADSQSMIMRFYMFLIYCLSFFKVLRFDRAATQQRITDESDVLEKTADKETQTGEVEMGNEENEGKTEVVESKEEEIEAPPVDGAHRCSSPSPSTSPSSSSSLLFDCNCLTPHLLPPLSPQPSLAILPSSASSASSSSSSSASSTAKSIQTVIEVPAVSIRELFAEQVVEEYSRPSTPEEEYLEVDTPPIEEVELTRSEEVSHVPIQVLKVLEKELPKEEPIVVESPILTKEEPVQVESPILTRKEPLTIVVSKIEDPESKKVKRSQSPPPYYSVALTPKLGEVKPSDPSVFRRYSSHSQLPVSNLAADDPHRTRRSDTIIVPFSNKPQVVTQPYRSTPISGYSTLSSRQVTFAPEAEYDFLFDSKGAPKLSYKTESVRIKRKTMDHMDEEQRDVMRQFDQVISEMDDSRSTETLNRNEELKHIGMNTLKMKRQSASKSTQETPVFVPPPPPTTEMHHHHQPKPRIARLVKNSPLDEFGFNLHAEKNLGHFIGTVDEGGIGEKAGLVMGQRIVGVNGQLVYPNTPHKEVVALIKKSPLSTTLLVASEDVDKWHRENGVEYVFSSAEEFNQHHHEVEHHNPAKSSEYEITPVINPHSIQVNEEREVSKTVTSTKTEITTTNTNAYQYKEPTTTHYDAYASPPTDDDIMNQVFAGIDTNLVVTNVTIHSDTQEHSVDASSVSSFSSHRESAVDVPVNQQYVPSYNSQSHLEDNHHHHHHSQTHQQPSPLSNGSSHGYAASSTSGYDDDDIYHLSAKEARERLRMKNRKPHLHEMSINEKYQLVSNM